MNLGIMALRLVHIGSAIMWAGGSIFLDRFFQPAAEELGPAGEPFVAALMRRGLAIYFPIVAGLTVLAGTTLYWIDSGGNMIGWLTGGGPGTVFGIGGIAAWIGFISGGIGVAPNAGKLSRARAEIAVHGTSAELEAQVASATAGLHRAGQIGLAAFAIAIACMAVARYA